MASRSPQPFHVNPLLPFVWIDVLRITSYKDNESVITVACTCSDSRRCKKRWITTRRSLSRKLSQQVRRLRLNMHVDEQNQYLRYPVCIVDDCEWGINIEQRSIKCRCIIRGSLCNAYHYLRFNILRRVFRSLVAVEWGYFKVGVLDFKLQGISTQYQQVFSHMR